METMPQMRRVRRNSSYRTAVASVQHHGDKLVYATRRGRLRVMTLPEFRDEGCPYGILTDGGAVVRETSPRVLAR